MATAEESSNLFVAPLVAEEREGASVFTVFILFFLSNSIQSLQHGSRPTHCIDEARRRAAERLRLTT